MLGTIEDSISRDINFFTRIKQGLDARSSFLFSKPTQDSENLGGVIKDLKKLEREAIKIQDKFNNLDDQVKSKKFKQDSSFIEPDYYDFDYWDVD